MAPPTGPTGRCLLAEGSPCSVFFIRRALLAVLTLIAISITTFMLFFAGPADPASIRCGMKICDQKTHDRINEVLGQNEPILTQYSSYMIGIIERHR